MGWWDWLFQKLSQSTPDAPRERVVAHHNKSDSTAVAVATVPAVPTDPPTQNKGSDTDPWWTPNDGALLDPIESKPEDCHHPVEFLENVLISHFDGHDLSIPLLNNVAEQILPKLRRANCDLKAVGREIAGDQILSAAVLRTVNSPMYRGVERITTVSAAVVRIGVKALSTILLHQSVRGAIFSKNSLTKHFANVLWRKSLGDACIMRGLAGLVRMDQDDCHLIGLMHDIGGVLVLRIINDEMKAGHTTVDLNSFEYLRQETHQEFGELIAKAWQLPPDLSQLITDHHRYPAPDDPLARHRWMLALTEMIGGMLYTDEPENYDLIHCRPAVELKLSDRLDYYRWLSQLPAEIEQTLQDSET